ncbi:hypothetical protein B7759_05027 [Burkholderia glumae]|nr:GDSL-like Lipase/Acylhydrolase family protein [Burkholderia glumae LMG 2196 = ATCC 33617]QKM56462.1 hypothetical protein CG017_04526 [Burkholderia glumae]QTP36389.1 hypothetical protein B7759_05027 [Burkholderia glumae]
MTSPTLIRLAQLIGENRDAPEIIDLVKSLVLGEAAAIQAATATRPPAGPAASKPAGAGDTIGCWRRGADHPQRFERVQDAQGNWRTWADLDHFELDGTARRVVFVGESAGRGFLYDPYLTPAGVLHKHLERLSASPVQVLDLARTNMSFTESVEISTRAAELLQPDALVLFAGNNWLSAGDIFGYVDLVGLSSALRADGIAGLVATLEQALEGFAARLVDTLSRIGASTGAKLVLAIPEFNLRDWKPGFTQAPPLLSGPALAQWEALRAEAEAARGAGDATRLERAADAMLALDGGYASHSLWLKAQALLHAQGAPAARPWLEKARDMAAILPVPQAPGMHTRSIDALRRHAAAAGIAVVDLPQRFAEAGSLPGREHFLDYCHLSELGIDTLARHVAAAVVTALGCGRPDPGKADDKPAYALSARARASAMFLAAIHNANWGQSGEIIAHWVDSAIDTAPDDVRLWYRSFLAFETCLQPRWTHQAFDDLDIAQVERYMGFKLNPHLADHELKTAMVRALARHGETGVREAWHAQLFDAYLRPGTPQDLLQPQHAARHHAALRPFHENPGYYQAIGGESDFAVISDGRAGAVLRSVIRVPRGLSGPARCTVSVNGRTLGTLAVGASWSRAETAIPADALVPGVNRLVLHWPAPERVDDTLVERAARSLSMQRGPEVFHVRGQIHRLTLTGASPTA